MNLVFGGMMTLIAILLVVSLRVRRYELRNSWEISLFLLGAAILSFGILIAVLPLNLLAIVAGWLLMYLRIPSPTRR